MARRPSRIRPAWRSPAERCTFFISSAYSDPALQEIRASIHNWADANSVTHWMFEYARNQAEWAATPPSQSISICLSELANCDSYVGFIHEAYGGTGQKHIANVAFTELEAFHALRLRKRMLIYVVEPSLQRSADTQSFLTILEHVSPAAFRGFGSAREVLAWAKDDMLALCHNHIHPAKARLGRFIDRTSRVRWSMLTGVSGLLLTPPQADDDHDLSSTTADQYIRSMFELSTLPRRDQEIGLSSLLPAIRGLPWRAHDCPNGQRVLDEFCEHWHRATVWHDNHYYGDCGCLAARNTQMLVRCLQAMGDEARTIDRQKFLELNQGLGSSEWIRVYTLGGALGSSYYSLGKQHGAGQARRYLLDQALRWVRVARKIQAKVDDAESYGAGLAAIAGHVHLAMRATEEAVQEFKLSVELLRVAGADGSSLAEAKGNLGYLLALQHSRPEGLRMVQEAASQLSHSAKEAFASRIKLKLAELYLRRLRVSAAIREVAEADAICRCHGMTLRIPATRTARIAIRAIRLLARPLVATVSRAGYTFVR